MYLVVGLGNPGKEYEMTRHNIGFSVIDYIANERKITSYKMKLRGLYADFSIDGEKVILLKPQTYMNLSGESVREFCSFYKIDIKHVIVICDDISLAVGRLRIRQKGSAGGHNGLKSIIYQLGSDEFARIKIGVGAPENKNYDLADYVLGKFTKDEIPVLRDIIVSASEAAREIVNSDVQSAMNKYNN